MKKLLKILSVIFVLFGVSVFAIPYFYKDKIIAFIKKDVNNTLNARFDFKDADAGIFSDFPNLHINLNEMTLDGLKEFKDIRLLDAKNIGFSLDLKSALFGDQVIVKKLMVKDAFVNIQVLKNGLANYDILKKEAAGNPEEKTHFNIKLNSYQIDNLTLNYKDNSMGFYTQLANLNHTGKGVLTDTIYQLKTHTSVEKANMIYDSIHYVKDARIDLVTDFDISGDFNTYSFKNARLLLNKLPVFADGYVALEPDAIDVNVAYQTKQAQLKDFLSLMPAYYLSDLKDVKTTGKAQLTGAVKGLIKGDDLPAFHMDLDLAQADLQYPDLPEKLSDIVAKVQLDFKGGDNLDAMRIDMPSIRFNIAKNVVTGHFNMTHPMTDPYVNTAFKSNMDLKNVEKAVKLKGIKELKGLLDADFSIVGALSDIEKQAYDKFKASGYINLQDFVFQSDSLNRTISIPKANLDIKPEYLQINDFSTLVGKSDFNVTGRIANYIAYMLGKDKTLEVTMQAHSKHCDLNEFMSSDNATDDDSEFEALRIPKNIKASIQYNADQVLYKDLVMNDTKGKLTIADQKADLSTVFMKMMGGKITMNGSYNSKNKNPKTTFQLHLDQLGIKESVSSFSVFSTYTPVLKQVAGRYFSNMNFSIDLDSLMNPILKTADIKGDFKTDKIFPKGVVFLSKIAKQTRLKALENPYIDKINASFSIKNGKFDLKPVHFKLNDMDAGLQGTVSLEQKLNMILVLDIPREKLGADINNVLSKITGGLQFLKLDKKLSNIIKMQFKIGGTTTAPTLKPIILNSENTGIDNAINELVEEQIEDVKNQAVEQAKQKAEELIKIAEFQKDKLLEEAHVVAEKTKVQAAATADKLIQEAGNDPLKKMAAKIAADKIKKTAAKKADKIIETATKKGDQLVDKARVEGVKLIEQAGNTPQEDSL